VWRDRTGAQRHRYVRRADVPTVRAILTERRERRRAERQAHAAAIAERRLIMAMVRGLRL
jgi:hypothetical protein